MRAESQLRKFQRCLAEKKKVQARFRTAQDSSWINCFPSGYFLRQLATLRDKMQACTLRSLPRSPFVSVEPALKTFAAGKERKKFLFFCRPQIHRAFFRAIPLNSIMAQNARELRLSITFPGFARSERATSLLFWGPPKDHSILGDFFLASILLLLPLSEKWLTPFFGWQKATQLNRFLLKGEGI